MLDRPFLALADRVESSSLESGRLGLRARAEPVRLGPGDDTYYGVNDRGPGDRIYGQGGDDLIRGERGDDKLYGGGGDDTLLGNAGRDSLYGGAGDDQLIGGKGHNFLFGGVGTDDISGGSGTDEVGYKAITDSLPGKSHDTVAFFDHGQDRFDLHKLDAIAATDGDDAFSWIGDQAFGGVAGELRYSPKTDLLQADVDGDGTADFEVYLYGSHGHLDVTDIIL